MIDFSDVSQFAILLFSQFDWTEDWDPRLLAVEFVFGIMLREPQVQAREAHIRACSPFMDD